MLSNNISCIPMNNTPTQIIMTLAELPMYILVTAECRDYYITLGNLLVCVYNVSSWYRLCYHNVNKPMHTCTYTTIHPLWVKCT